MLLCITELKINKLKHISFYIVISFLIAKMIFYIQFLDIFIWVHLCRYVITAEFYDLNIYRFYPYIDTIHFPYYLHQKLLVESSKNILLIHYILIIICSHPTPFNKNYKLFLVPHTNILYLSLIPISRLNFQYQIPIIISFFCDQQYMVTTSFKVILQYFKIFELELHYFGAKGIIRNLEQVFSNTMSLMLIQEFTYQQQELIY